ncbi:hypothetical protein BC826DRAFT_34679 [Russula brevipes]|nr:hypothetical protein BC826DRAFT_34679 [Russula brevipes]
MMSLERQLNSPWDPWYASRLSQHPGLPYAGRQTCDRSGVVADTSRSDALHPLADKGDQTPAADERDKEDGDNHRVVVDSIHETGQGNQDKDGDNHHGARGDNLHREDREDRDEDTRNEVGNRQVGVEDTHSEEDGGIRHVVVDDTHRKRAVGENIRRRGDDAEAEEGAQDQGPPGHHRNTRSHGAGTCALAQGALSHALSHHRDQSRGQDRGRDRDMDMDSLEVQAGQLDQAEEGEASQENPFRQGGQVEAGAGAEDHQESASC